MKGNIKIIRSNHYLQTEGLKEQKGFELKILINNHSESDYKSVFTYVCDYVLLEDINIKNEETLAFHSWLLQFRFDKNDLIYLWELSEDGSIFLEGVDFAIKIVRDQEEECRKRMVKPLFPTFSQKIVISKGVYEGYGVDAVRYPSPNHMTGWWLTTELYDDNIDSLMVVHFYHVAFKRPDILKYLALPFGYRFYVANEQNNISFDESILEDN